MLSVNILAFINTYSNNPCKCVQARNLKSKYFPQTLLQVSTLGSPFFIIFIIDIANTVDVFISLFADDLLMFADNDSGNDCKRSQHNLDVYTTGVSCVGLNASKCNVMSYTRKINVYNCV